MRYRPSEDWVTPLAGVLRGELLATLRGLSLARLQKYPPPKLQGLPVGNEGRVLRRYLKGRSSQLDASALSSLYRSLAPARARLLYRAFRQNDVLRPEEWAAVLGREAVDRWRQHGLLRPVDDGLRARFCAVALDGLPFVVDPLNDHGGAHETAALPDTGAPEATDAQSFHHTYVGQDSVRMIEWLEPRLAHRYGRYLDCGTGAGALLLYFSRRVDEAVGVDINPRAIQVARFNAELNGQANCRCVLGDALAPEAGLGRFDLVTWNLPFIFLPQESAQDSIDGYGGAMGIELCLKFVEALPALLTATGRAYVAALAPILLTGERLLEVRLRELLPRAGLDCVLAVSQASWAHTRELWRFHRSQGVRRFESVYLRLQPGTGILRRVDAGAARRLLDVVRGRLYERRFA